MYQLGEIVTIRSLCLIRGVLDILSVARRPRFFESDCIRLREFRSTFSLQNVGGLNSQREARWFVHT